MKTIKAVWGIQPILEVRKEEGGRCMGLSRDRTPDSGWGEYRVTNMESDSIENVPFNTKLQKIFIEDVCGYYNGKDAYNILNDNGFINTIPYGIDTPITREEADNGNSLILRICGIDYISETKTVVFDNGQRLSISDINYHLRWEELMPVIKVINDINSKDKIERLNNGNTPAINGTDEEFNAHMIFSLPLTSPIHVIWRCVVDYIKWYNSYKNK